MTRKFDPEFYAIRAALVSKPELTRDLNVSIRNLLRLTEHLQNSGLRMERHGRWEFVEQRFYLGGFINMFRCPECKNPTDREFNYCPNCGAKMDGGTEND